MMQSNVSTKKWQYWATLPLFLLCFTLFSCGDYAVKEEGHAAVSSDLAGEIIDTIFTFDPETKTETVKYVKREATEITDTETESPKTGIDTIIIFDPADYSETVIVVNHDTGETDTIQ